MGILSSLQFNDETTIPLGNNDIIVFVGPNNAGKSQSLKDIYKLCENENNDVTVIKHLEFTKPSQEDLVKSISKNCRTVNNGGYVEYKSHGFSMSSHSLASFQGWQALGPLRNYLVSHLSTEERLRLANPPQQINRTDPWTHPIHYPSFDSTYRKRLSDCFERAFGSKIVPNVLNGRTVPLCIGNDLAISEADATYQEAIESYSEILGSYEQVQNQGDGIRSFVGITLNMMLDNYELFLLDEPESFLHPPQAKIMGETIGELAKQSTQVIISTHSKEIVQGVTEACPSRVKVIRITREGSANTFSVLNNDLICSIWSDSLLRHSEIMNCMFHSSAVICESDSDCKMYSIVFDHWKQSANLPAQTQFIHCGGKSRVASIVKILRSIGVDYRAVVDIDILDNRDTLKKLAESCGGDFEAISVDYNNLRSQIVQQKTPISKESLSSILDSASDPLTDPDIKAIEKALSAKSPWAPLKKSGRAAIPHGNATRAFDNINAYMQSLGVFIVPVGEIESFVPSIGNHGPKWVEDVLDAYPDLSNPVYHAITQFVETWQL